MHLLLLVALGGALGAVSRWMIYVGLERVFSAHFPWATLLVNTLGSFTAGFLLSFFVATAVPGGARLLLLTGFLGAFTTFSTFALETVQMMHSGHYLSALINVIVNNLLSLLAVMLGICVAQSSSLNL